MSNMANRAYVPLRCVPIGVLPSTDIGLAEEIGPDLFAVTGNRVALFAAKAEADDRPAFIAEHALALASEAARLCTAFLPMRPALLPTVSAAEWVIAQSPQLETSLLRLAGKTQISLSLSSVVPSEGMRSGEGAIRRRLASAHSTRILKLRARRALSQLGQRLPYPDRAVAGFQRVEQERRMAGATLSLLVSKAEAGLALSDLKRLASVLRHMDGFRASFCGHSPAYSFVPAASFG